MADKSESSPPSGNGNRHSGSMRIRIAQALRLGTKINRSLPVLHTRPDKAEEVETSTETTNTTSEIGQPAEPAAESPEVQTEPPFEYAADNTCQVSLKSKHIYSHKGKRGLWFGRPQQFPAPESLDSQAIDRVKERLDTDLESLRRKLVRKAAQEGRPRYDCDIDPPELRMSGYAPGARPTSVTLSPCLWVFCRSKWALSHVRKTLRNLDWIQGSLDGFSLDQCVGGAAFCMKPPVVDLRELKLTGGWSYGGGRILYHIAKLRPKLSSSSSICGWLCCVSYVKWDTLVSQNISRVGGILTPEILGLNGKSDLNASLRLFCGSAMTTAHGAFDSEQPASEDLRSGSNQLLSDPGSDVVSNDGDSSCAQEELSDIADDEDVGFSNGLEIGDSDVSQEVDEWLELGEPSGANFLGKGLGVQLSHDPKDNKISDYMLLKSDMVRLFNNSYRVEETHAPPRVETITSYLKNAELASGPIRLILGFDEVEEGFLLPGLSTVYFNSKPVKVGKVQLRAELAQGNSGAWLVRGSCFCGMVIARSQGEPLALFVSAEDIIADLRSSISEFAPRPKITVTAPSTVDLRDTKLEFGYEPPPRPEVVNTEHVYEDFQFRNVGGGVQINGEGALPKARKETGEGPPHYPKELEM